MSDISNPFNIDTKAMRVAALEGTVKDLQDANMELNNMLCMVIRKVAGEEPFVITSKDQEEMPRMGVLHVHADEKTSSLSIMFKEAKGDPK